MALLLLINLLPVLLPGPGFSLHFPPVPLKCSHGDCFRLAHHCCDMVYGSGYTLLSADIVKYHKERDLSAIEMDLTFQKGLTMKTVSLFAVLAIAVFLIGCENPELVSCQQEKDLMQGQLDQANTIITEKDTNIEALKTENTEMQTKAMESITTIMTKQAARDNELKQKLVERAKQIQDLEAKVAALETQIAEHVCAVSETAAAETDEVVE